MKNIGQSLIILFFIAIVGTQAAASFGLIHNHRYWPFLSYPMYNTPHFPGDAVARYSLVAIADDGTERAVRKEELKFNFWQYIRGPVQAALRGERGELLRILAPWESKTGFRISAVRLENRPVALTETGFSDQPTQSVTINLSEVAP